MKNDNTGNGKSKRVDITELEKENQHIIVEVLEYVPNAVMSRTIFKKSTGNITAMSVSEGEEFCERIIPFDNYIQVIDGAADIRIGKKDYHLKVGSGIIIPAHSEPCFYAKQQFKIISTIIKSGYED